MVRNKIGFWVVIHRIVINYFKNRQYTCSFGKTLLLLYINEEIKITDEDVLKIDKHKQTVGKPFKLKTIEYEYKS